MAVIAGALILAATACGASSDVGRTPLNWYLNYRGIL